MVLKHAGRLADSRCASRGVLAAPIAALRDVQIDIQSQPEIGNALSIRRKNRIRKKAMISGIATVQRMLIRRLMTVSVV